MNEKDSTGNNDRIPGAETTPTPSGVQGENSNGNAKITGRREEGYQVKPEVIPDEVKEKAIESYIPAALNANLIAFNSYKIKREYPKVYQKLYDYMFEKAGVNQSAVDDDTISGVLLYTPRSVTFDFLDENGIYLGIIKTSRWAYNIHNDNNLVEGLDNFKTRLEAEIKGFDRALYFLENKLK